MLPTHRQGLDSGKESSTRARTYIYRYTLCMSDGHALIYFTYRSSYHSVLPVICLMWSDIRSLSLVPVAIDGLLFLRCTLHALIAFRDCRCQFLWLYYCNHFRRGMYDARISENASLDNVPSPVASLVLDCWWGLYHGYIAAGGSYGVSICILLAHADPNMKISLVISKV